MDRAGSWKFMRSVKSNSTKAISNVSPIDALYNNIVDIFETVNVENEKSPIKCVLYKYNVGIDKLYVLTLTIHILFPLLLKLTSPDDPFIHS